MKLATIKTDHGMGDYIPLRDMNDVDDYVKFAGSVLIQDISDFLKSDLPESRIDHFYGSNHSTLHAGIMTAKVLGGNPLYRANEIFASKRDSFVRIVNEGDVVLVNQKGGYQTLLDDHEVISEMEFSNSYINYDLKEGTEWIMLENDPEPDTDGTPFFKGEDFSYVCNLRECMAHGLLTNLLKKFEKMGGKYVYVFTTGLDENQRERYTNAVKYTGLKLTVKVRD